MKIVHFDTGRELRGGQRQLLLLAEGLRRRGHEQLIVCPESSRLEARAGAGGFAVFPLAAHDPGYAHSALDLRVHLATAGFEIAHAHDGRGQTLAWMATAGRPVSRVASRRVTFLPSGLGAALHLHRLKYTLTAHAVIAVSAYVRGLLIRSGVPEAKIAVIPDGIEIPGQLPGAETRAGVRAGWGFSEREFVIGQVGAFTPEKGQDIAVEAMALLRDKLPQARLLLVGDAPQGLGRERAGDRVRRLGVIEELGEFFAGLNLLVMPSRAEGLGSSALLAMAHGLPVVASRVGGLPEVVGDAAGGDELPPVGPSEGAPEIEETGCGWLVSPGRGGSVAAAALADAIVLAAQDRGRLRARGERARARAQEFSSDIMAARTEALYGRLRARPAHPEEGAAATA
ncbi:MAG TPA: glycosyltransferase family 4 protein [Terriglobia bacterium]|nr:glycosyltransferase family 4 protein [Terriglobia bacterium]